MSRLALSFTVLSMRVFWTCFFCAAVAFVPQAAHAEKTDPETSGQNLTQTQRLMLAREFVSRIKQGYTKAEQKLQAENPSDLGRLPDGEILFFRFRLDKKFWLDTPVLTRVEGGKLLVSLRDLCAALDFPIEISPDGQTAEGWYIREARIFSLQANTRSVQTAEGRFSFSDDVLIEEGDIFVPAEELNSWFNFTLNPYVAALEFKFESPLKLPLLEQLERRNRLYGDKKIGPPVLPLMETPVKGLDAPLVDVSTSNRYTRPGSGQKATFSNRATVQTTGDFAYGTLGTTSQWDREERLTNLRTNYRKEVLEPELLGPLKARRYELGDIIPVDIPLNDTRTYGIGMRVTNAHPLRNFLRPSTEITGTAIPGWDVELFREEQFLAFQTVDEGGQYRFENVDLFANDNNFRLVFYGPQGEIREEALSIPVDPKRIAEMGSAYDVSVYAQNTQTYMKNESRDLDRGTPNVTAYYERPIGDLTALSAGFSNRQDNGEMTSTGYAGLSTSIYGALVNFNTGVQQDGEAAGEVVVRHKIGDHDIRNETRVSTEDYGFLETEPTETGSNVFFSAQNTEDDLNVFSNDFGVNGPLPFDFGKKPRYSLSLDYTQTASGEFNLATSGAVSNTWKTLSLSEQILHETGSAREEDKLASVTSVSGRIGKNRVRMLADYEVKPDSGLKRVAASVQRKITPDLDLDVGVQRFMDTKLTEFTSQMNWFAGYANISPGITYNTDRDLTATLYTRFGLSRDPVDGHVRMFDTSVSGNGAVSAFVFLDKDGDNVFNGDDEVIPNVLIRAPQNGGRMMTDEKGYAYFERMAKLRATDIYVDKDSLPDPLWLPAREGVSIIPREGHAVPIQFPIYRGGEIDGSVYARGTDPEDVRPMRTIRLGLYDLKGKRILSTTSESDGFYLLTPIPPGLYYLNVDEPGLEKNLARPLPQLVQVSFDGTIIYSNNIYLQEGQSDSPIRIIADDHEFHESPQRYAGRTLALNLGEYKSPVTMGLAWFKAKTMGATYLNETDLVSKPSETLPDKDSGLYTLRVMLRDHDVESAYRRCAALNAAGISCTLEIRAAALSQRLASVQ